MNLYTERHTPKVKGICEARKIVQQSRALAVLPVDSGSISNTHMAAHSCLQCQFQGIQHPPLALEHAHAWFTDIHAG